MYSSQQYQYQQPQPQQQQQQPQQQPQQQQQPGQQQQPQPQQQPQQQQSQPQGSAPPPQQPPAQSQIPPSQPHYQGYSYPAPPVPQPIAPAPPAQNYPQYPSAAYSYAVPAPPGYYYIPPGYPNPYPGQIPSYQSPYARPPYPPAPSTIPPQYPQYNAQPYYSNGHPQQPIQPYPPRIAPGTHHSSPPSKRQKLEPRPPHTNGSHSHGRKSSRTLPKEKKTFSDFRVSRIKVGNFNSDELRFDASIRDSRLRFYFRSAGAPYAVPTQHPGDNIAAQFPDRLSVSLHKGTRRIVLPAEHLTAVHFNRVDGHVRIEGDGWAAFEEIRSEELDETASTTSKTGHAGPKFGPSEEDPTGGEWARCKVIEIWLNTTNPLTEPKWTKGNLRDNIDPSSLFHGIIHVTDIDTGLNSATFDEMVWSWREKSMIASPDARNALVAEFTSSDRLVELLERAVQTVYPPFTPLVEGLLALVKDKDTLQNELKQILLRIPADGVWRALDTMAVEDVLTETPRSGLSINPSTKREREDEEMDVTSAKEGSPHDPSLPTSAVDNISDAPETSVTLGGDIAVEDSLDIDFSIPLGADHHVGHDSFVDPTSQ